jgi:hypothetical protein
MISLLLLGFTIGTFVNKNVSYKLLATTSVVGLIETTFSFPSSIAVILTCAGMYGIYCISNDYISQHQTLEDEEGEGEDEGEGEGEDEGEGEGEDEDEDENEDEGEDENEETEKKEESPEAPVEAPTGSTGPEAPTGSNGPEAPTGSTGPEAPVEAPTGSTGPEAPVEASSTDSSPAPNSPNNTSSDMSCDTPYDDLPPLVDTDSHTYLPTFQYD